MINFNSPTNFQISPSKVRVITNDRLSKKIFELTQDDLSDELYRNVQPQKIRRNYFPY